MLDYRDHLKKILQKTSGDEKSLANSLTAIKLIINMAEGGQTLAAPKKKAKEHLDPATQRQIKQLLTGLTQLIKRPGDAAAKKSSLSALRRLTFVPDVGQEYGQELGHLEQAVQASVKTTAAVNAHLFKEAMKPKKRPKRDYRKGKRYTVIRRVSGADLINSNGEVAFTVSEAQAHPLNLKSGDIVEALPLPHTAKRQAEIIRVVGYEKLRQRDYDPIAEFKYAVVQGRQGHLSISRDIHGQKLRVRGKAITVPVDSSYYQGDNVSLADGSIVDLAWYTGDVRLKQNPEEAVQIRWIYQMNPDQPLGHKKKKSKGKKTNEVSEQKHSLDMDLHYQRVGIAVGANQNEQMLEDIVTSYHGIPIPIDAFEGKKKIIENEVKDLDLVILVTAFAAHDSTWNIRDFAAKYKVKFAVSSSKGYQSFERALYRADQGLPAYEGTQSIEYKQRKK